MPRHPPYALSHLTLSESPELSKFSGLFSLKNSSYIEKSFFSESPELSKLSGLLLKNSSLMKNLSFWFFLGSNCNVTLLDLKTLNSFLV